MNESCQKFTPEAVSIIFGIQRWEACLLGLSIHGVHSQPPTPTLRTGIVDWIPDTAIHQPAGTALVKASSPGCMELTGGRQYSALFLTARSSFIISETLSRAHVENLTCGGFCLMHMVNIYSSYQAYKTTRVHLKLIATCFS